MGGTVAKNENLNQLSCTTFVSTDPGQSEAKYLFSTMTRKNLNKTATNTNEEKKKEKKKVEKEEKEEKEEKQTNETTINPILVKRDPQKKSFNKQLNEMNLESSSDNDTESDFEDNSEFFTDNIQITESENYDDDLDSDPFSEESSDY
ncbi:hypothetical protein M0813_01141 [Anaeramoeba flamelloides]|uniref:Uncharacterized protein n=1 Tax=Anaeramoeba flamelloides TaxID=1746091 RepID=A0ABQ8X2F1_9EUKA|nr:hypothetical protein M0813_01141 [Anaeramoeba flamelloides]